MKAKKMVLGFILLILGTTGIASMLTMDIPIPPEVATILEAQYSPDQIKLLILINPMLMLTIAVFVGTLLYQKVDLSVPLIEKSIGIKNDTIEFSEVIKYGVIGGVLSGILLSLVSLIFVPLLPAEFIELGESLKPTLAARFLYGGITEEILMRFGIMTLLVWIFSKVFRGKQPIVYWMGILVASLLFALGHFPIAYQAVENPTTSLLIYILIGNSIGGIIFGWLYWKKGLESAFIAHIFTHVIMVLGELILN